MTYVKAKSNTAFSPMRDPIDRRSLHIGIVLLVGGQSKRMGCNKQLLPWRGKTVLDAVCGALHCGWNDSVELTESCKLPFVAVTGDDHKRLEPIVTSYGFEVVQNEHPNRGQGLSIAIGVRHLVENSPIPLDGILCSVGDQRLGMLYIRLLVHLVITFIRKLSSSRIMGRIISREILFCLVHIGLNHCNISKGIKVAKLSFAVVVKTMLSNCGFVTMLDMILTHPMILSV